MGFWGKSKGASTGNSVEKPMDIANSTESTEKQSSSMEEMLNDSDFMASLDFHENLEPDASAEELQVAYEAFQTQKGMKADLYRIYSDRFKAETGKGFDTAQYKEIFKAIGEQLIKAAYDNPDYLKDLKEQIENYPVLIERVKLKEAQLAEKKAAVGFDSVDAKMAQLGELEEELQSQIDIHMESEPIKDSPEDDELTPDDEVEADPTTLGQKFKKAPGKIWQKFSKWNTARKENNQFNQEKDVWQEELSERDQKISDIQKQIEELRNQKISINEMETASDKIKSQLGDMKQDLFVESEVASLFKEMMDAKIEEKKKILMDADFSTRKGRKQAKEAHQFISNIKSRGESDSPDAIDFFEDWDDDALEALDKRMEELVTRGLSDLVAEFKDKVPVLGKINNFIEKLLKENPFADKNVDEYKKYLKETLDDLIDNGSLTGLSKALLINLNNSILAK